MSGFAGFFRRHKSLLAVLGLVGLSFVEACTAQDGIPVRKLLVDVMPGAEGPEQLFSREKVREISQTFLREDGRFVLKEPAADVGDVLRVRLESFSKIVVPKKGPVLHLSLGMEWQGKEPSARAFQFQAHSFVASDAKTPPAALLKQALDESIGQLLQAHSAREQPSERLLAWIGDAEMNAERKLQAIRVLGARGDATATMALVDMLGQPDVALASAALGSLTRIGDPRAVDAVIEYAERKPPVVRKQAIEAIRTMGTFRGMAWLFTLSTGHRHPEVRASAALALTELEKKRPSEAPGTNAVRPDGQP